MGVKETIEKNQLSFEKINLILKDIREKKWCHNRKIKLRYRISSRQNYRQLSEVVLLQF